MEFRPCIDIHNGKVKQIVGSSLSDKDSSARENFVSGQDAAFYARLYQKDQIRGGHIILLNPQGTQYYELNRKQAGQALLAYPGGLQIGGGITLDNAQEFLHAGASHVIVTSYVFKDGSIHYGNLEKLAAAVGKERLVLDLSCRRVDGGYVVVTDRWQKFTEVRLSLQVLEEIASYCDEFLVHGVDVEGRSCGVDERLSGLLGSYSGAPVTYAGGIGSLADLNRFRDVTGGKIDFTIGSALDIFGGKIPFEVVKDIRSCE